VEQKSWKGAAEERFKLGDQVKEGAAARGTVQAGGNGGTGQGGSGVEQIKRLSTVETDQGEFFLEQIKGRLFLFGAFTLAGTSVIAARFLTGSLGTFTITAVSLFFAVLGLLPLCREHLARSVASMRRADWVPVVLQAVFGIFLFRMFLLFGLRYTSSGEAGILTGTTPAVTALLAWLLLKEAMDKKAAAGVCCTVAGILLLQGLLTPQRGFEAGHLLGNLLVLGAAGSESVFNVLSRLNSLKKSSGGGNGVDPVIQTALVAGIAFVLCLFPSFLENPWLPLISLGIREWLALVWYGLVVTALAFVCWYAGIKRCAAHTAAAFSGMMPFTALLLSVLILGERPGWEQWAGGLLVILGMVIIGSR